ncbi:MAG: tetratricopeptide repeat protein, partial [Candidatus Zixiibacteriota bacterium]
QSHRKLKSFPAALKEYRATIRIKKDYANAHNGMGRIYLTQEKYGKAIAAYRQSVKYNPKGYRAYYNLAIAIQSNDPDDLEASIAGWKQALRVAKKIPKAKDIAKRSAEQIEKLEKQKTNQDLNN